VIIEEAVVSVDKWQIREMSLTMPKLHALWRMLQRHGTLFSDLTKNDPENFTRTILEPNAMWFEIVEYDTIVGIIWFGEMWKVTDCMAHMAFFDRAPAEKLEVCREIVRWMFRSFPLQRMTVQIPEIYFGTVRLMKRLGFTREGEMREAVLLGGRWKSIVIFGITRSEVESMP
jgi:Acetyltransferases, including N-acetylases of ribosomal proteins